MEWELEDPLGASVRGRWHVDEEPGVVLPSLGIPAHACGGSVSL